jgi:hypothetical protein
MKFLEHGQLYVALAQVKNPGDFCILLPSGIDDFTIRPAVDIDVVQILETMQSSRPPPIPQISPGDNVVSGIVSIDPSDATLSDEFPCPDDYIDAPEDQIRCIPSLDHDSVETFDPYPDRYLSMFRSCHGSLRMNRCFDLISSQISSLESLSPDLLCPLRHFSVGYFKPAAQNLH